MKDRLYFPLIAAAMFAAIGLASIWPQGFGARSPGPLGHVPIHEVRAATAGEVKLRSLDTKALAASAALAAGLRQSH